MTKPVTHIDINKFARWVDAASARVLDILRDHHIDTRIVGGAVRDALLGHAPRDIDFVVNCDPSEIIFLFEMYDIETDVSGIAHGTVKAVFGYGHSQQKIDVTSLGYRIQLHNSHVDTIKHNTWPADSAMRDLSINAMSMDMKGRVWDYQHGYKDLQQQRVRLSDWSRRHLSQDPNTMMRYFKALTMFDHPRVLRSDLKLIARLAHNLASAGDDERVMKNLITIQKSHNSKQILALMCALGISRHLPYVKC